MNNETMITILGQEIPFISELVPIYKLKYLISNPRVHSSIYGQDLPQNLEEQQKLIQEQMSEEASVKNLIPDVKKQGGLVEPIFVRHDTMEVIEGNSRLTVYRYLDKTDQNSNGKWANIPCQIVSSLTNKQQYAYLNQIHVKGKTPWVAYEKANHAYIIKKTEESTDEEIADTLSATPTEIRKRIKTIVLMEENGDKERSHFSYYNVLVRTKKISEELKHNSQLENVLLYKIKKIGAAEANNTDFTSQELRDKLPTILNKKKETKKFIDGNLTLDEAFQNARLSGPHQNVKVALEKIQDIERNEIRNLEQGEINALLQSVKNLNRAI